MIRIAIVLQNTNRVKTICPGEFQSVDQAKAEIMHRNARFPLAARLERVVWLKEDN